MIGTTQGTDQVLKTLKLQNLLPVLGIKVGSV
jgi:hypothetical protein